MSPILEIKTLASFTGLPIPFYATSHSAGLDLAAAVETAYTLKPGDRFLVPTGLIFALPLGFEGQIRPRSGLALNYGITVLNSPGTIDADYRGEIKVLLINLGNEDFTITRGLRIAQFVLAPFGQATCTVVTELSEIKSAPSSIRTGGFGSTGL